MLSDCQSLAPQDHPPACGIINNVGHFNAYHPAAVQVGKQRGEKWAKRQQHREEKEQRQAAERAAKEAARQEERALKERALQEQRLILMQGLDDLDILANEQKRLAALRVCFLRGLHLCYIQLPEQHQTVHRFLCCVCVLCQDRKQPQLQSSMHRVPSTEFHAQSSMHRVPCTEFHAQSSMHRVPCTEFHAQSSEHRVPCTEFRAQSSMHRVPCTEFRAQSSMHRVPCTEFRATVCSPSFSSDTLQPCSYCVHENMNCQTLPKRACTTLHF
jgi:hypothetical protein